MADSTTNSMKPTSSLRYAAGMFGTSIPVNMFKTYAAFFYVDKLGLITTPQYSLILFLYTFLDAIDNPVYGFLSDRTRSKWGRRRPWLIIGAPLLVLCFVLFFNPPAFLAPGVTLPYVLLMYMFTGTLDSLIRWDVDAGFNGYYNHPAGWGYFKTAELWAVEDDWLCYYYDYLTVASALSAQEDPQRRAELAALLDESFAAQRQSSQAGRAALKAVLEGTPDTALAFTAVGHSHLDLAWLWPMRETRRKAVRTFTHQIANTRHQFYPAQAAFAAAAAHIHPDTGPLQSHQNGFSGLGGDLLFSYGDGEYFVSGKLCRPARLILNILTGAEHLPANCLFRHAHGFQSRLAEIIHDLRAANVAGTLREIRNQSANPCFIQEALLPIPVFYRVGNYQMV